MAPLELEGTSLKEKHQNYNKLVKNAIASNAVIEPGDLNSGENDVEHLMKIDIACNNRDVEYILKVLKCEDMFYVSRAIKRSTWLISEQQYAHIINPTYITTHLFPEMNLNAQTKFMKHIRLHLKDEARAAQFFDYEVNNTSMGRAVKWLPNCSPSFIITNIQQCLKYINVRLFKRLCEKSPNIVHSLLDKTTQFVKLLHCKLEVANFLLHVDPENYLHVVEQQSHYCFPEFGVRTTKLLMQQCPDRVIINFEKYCDRIHLPTFVKYLKQENIKDFLFTQAKKDDSEMGRLENLLYDPKKVKFFLDAMTKEQRTQFVDQVFINKLHNQEDIKETSEKFGMRKFYLKATARVSEYEFYDFDAAFDKITKCIRSATTSQEQKKNLLWTLVKCAGTDQKNIQTLLKYYHEKHINDPINYKEEFITKILPQIYISKLTSESWMILENLFKQIELYCDSEKNVPGCVELIILYKVTHGEHIPEVIEKKFDKYCVVKHVKDSNVEHDRRLRSIVIHCMKKTVVREIRNTLKGYSNKLNKEDKEKVFKYLYNKIFTKIQNMQITNETDFKAAVGDLDWLLSVLLDWKKELADYSWVLDKVKEYLKIKKDHSWKTDMSAIYNKKKSWKRLMFEESIELYPSEIVCLNALKHDDKLLSKDAVNSLHYNDAVSLRRLLNKLRVFWPQTLAAEWTKSYLDALNQPQGHKALVRGLCALLPRQQLLQIIHNYAPKEAKIDFNKASEIPLSLQRQIAKNMHLARPRPPPDAILLYAKGDYLQYAIPSLLVVYNNMNVVQTRQSITPLLSAPVSIQKHGIRIACAKMKPEEVIPVFRDIWTNTTNCTIRAVVFKFTFSLLGKYRNLHIDIWETLFVFINNLSQEEDKTIYEIISKTETLDMVPINKKAEYFMKTYTFLKQLIPKLPTEQDKSHYAWKLEQMVLRTMNFMECIPTHFIIDRMSEFIEESFMKKRVSFRFGSKCEMLKVVVAFLWCKNADKTQTERYEMFFVPLLERCFALWDKMENKEYFVRSNLDELLEMLRKEKQYAHLTIYEDIQNKLSQLPLPENYIMIRKWDLFIELARILNQRGWEGWYWDAICVEAAPEFGNKCLELLKRDVSSHFPCIYLLFSTVLKRIMDLMPFDAQCEIYRCLLQDSQFIQAYLTVMRLYPAHRKAEDLPNLQLVHTMLSQHPSIEVKMHYNHKFTVDFSLGC